MVFAVFYGITLIQVYCWRKTPLYGSRMCGSRGGRPDPTPIPENQYFLISYSKVAKDMHQTPSIKHNHPSDPT